MSFKKKHILAISGSTRKHSSNERILIAIAKLFDAEVSLELYNQIDSLPHFNPDLDSNTIPSVQNLYERIKKADGVIICTPEYVFSVPGALKNALEWTVATTVFSDKPVAFIVAAASGEKAFESLDVILKTLIQRDIPDGSKLLIKGGKGKIDHEGQFSDEVVMNDIKQLVNSLLRAIEKQNIT